MLLYRKSYNFYFVLHENYRKMGGKNVRAKKSRRKATIKITKGARKKLKKVNLKE